MHYRIGQVAALTKVSVRLLHHYDELGLLVPSHRSEAGYRLYTRTDLQRLQQILFYRELEFSLTEILRVMNAPDFDRKAALLQQRELLRGKAAQLAAVIDLLERSLAESASEDEDNLMSNEAMFEVFPELKQEDMDEAQQRWGDTEAWKQSAIRSRQYTKADWERMKQEMEVVNTRLETLFRSGTAPDAPEAVAAIDAARLLIGKWHYDCSKEFHVNLTAMTSNDERFVRNIDRNCAGLAAWIHLAAKANLAR